MTTEELLKRLNERAAYERGIDASIYGHAGMCHSRRRITEAILVVNEELERHLADREPKRTGMMCIKCCTEIMTTDPTVLNKDGKAWHIVCYVTERAESAEQKLADKTRECELLKACFPPGAFNADGTHVEIRS